MARWWAHFTVDVEVEAEDKTEAEEKAWQEAGFDLELEYIVNMEEEE